jgi:hypothetical protein
MTVYGSLGKTIRQERPRNGRVVDYCGLGQTTFLSQVLLELPQRDFDSCWMWCCHARAVGPQDSQQPEQRSRIAFAEFPALCKSWAYASSGEASGPLLNASIVLGLVRSLKK